MATEDYISVAGDDWYQRRREDEEGKFFRSVADQGPRKGQGGSTRQGIYCMTASGKLLAYKNAGQSPEVMRDVLRQGLAEWSKLPESQRRPGSLAVPDLRQIDERYSRTPPAGGLIVKVYARSLDRDGQGDFCDAECNAGRGDEASRDHLWITRAEAESLVKPAAKKGERYPLPARIAERIGRFHLIDNTRGEPPMWRRDDIRKSDLVLVVEQADASGSLLRLEGHVLLATAAEPERADRGYDARLMGYVQYDATRRAIDRFDVVAVGDHWGEGPYTRGARPGRTPLGVAFELVSGDSPTDRIPPQAAREIAEYLPRENRP